METHQTLNLIHNSFINLPAFKGPAGGLIGGISGFCPIGSQTFDLHTIFQKRTFCYFFLNLNFLVLDTYLNALTHLWTLQVSHKVNSYPNPRAECRPLLHNFKKTTFDLSRKAYKDRGLNSIKDGFIKDGEFNQLVDNNNNVMFISIIEKAHPRLTKIILQESDQSLQIS